MNVSGFVDWLGLVGRPRFVFSEVPRPLREQLQYALQVRHDERGSRLFPEQLNRAVKLLREAGISDLTKVGDNLTRLPSAGDAGAAYARYAHRAVAQRLGNPEEEWLKDRWDLRLLGFADERAGIVSLRFDGPPDWMRALLKRWVRWRLQTVPAGQVHKNLAAVRAFAAWAETEGIPLDRPELLTRACLERYAVYLRTSPLPGNSRQRMHSALKVFLDHVKLHGWEERLPANAFYLRGEAPPKERMLPRFVPERVMAQIEDESNLRRITDPSIGCVLRVVIGAGLRGGDAVALPFDALSTDPSGANYLRFINHKFKREAVVPITEKLAGAIREQQARVRNRWGDSPWLFPRRTKNIDGQQHLTTSSVRQELRNWIERCDIRDEHGARAVVTLHQFRHTFATRLVNDGVELGVVKELLDHSSIQMTEGYAKLRDTTLRREFDRYQKRVNVKGEMVPLSPDGPLRNAEWAKERLSRAKQTLPNGYCGRPLQQECPHPNACLTCPDFLTTEEFLPIHIDQRAATARLIEEAQDAGQDRIVDMNKVVLLNLDTMIAELSEPAEESDERAA